MKKFACILGIILSVALIALGAYTMLEGLTGVQLGDKTLKLTSPNFSGDTASSSSFGADFYTYSYRATRYAANNVDELGDYLQEVVDTGMGTAMIVAGLFGLLLSFYGIGVANDSRKKMALLRQLVGKQTATPAAPAPTAAPAPKAVAAQPAPQPQPAPAVTRTAPSTSGSAWICPSCSMQNDAGDIECRVCGQKR